MSREQTNIVGIVFSTICITFIVMVGGWFAATRYLGQPAVSAPAEEVSTSPAPRRKAPRKAAGNDSAPGNVARDSGPSSNPVPAGAPGSENSPASAAGGDDPSSLTGQLPPRDAESADSREASDTPNAAPESPVPPSAADNQGNARSIMEEAQRRTESKSHQYVGLLQAFDTNGKVAEKRWTFDRAGSHGQSKAVLRFTAPPEVKGVALLIENHPDRASDQWMWTPALERDRRIALQDRSTRFFGTDFSFEDLEERDVDQYDYAMLGDDTIADAICWKIQLTPKERRSSQYTRSIAWIRKDNYALARLDNFVKDAVVRRLTSSKIENIQGIWTGLQLEMVDLRRGSRTRLTLQQVKYNVPVKNEDFTLQAIRRIGN